MLAAQDDIATIMTVESGKPFAESKGEFTSGYMLLPRTCCHIVPCTFEGSNRSSHPGVGMALAYAGTVIILSVLYLSST